MYLIIGLGNPGKKYAKTRHNLGFMTVDRLADKLGVKINKLKHKALTGDTVIGGQKVIIAKPQTFMNLSGEAAGEIANFYKVEPEHIIVIYDDMDIDSGTIRIRKKGSPGTHNGMKSVVQHLGTQEFPRIRIGIGEHGGTDAVNYVVGSFSGKDEKIAGEAVERAADAAVSIIEDGIDKAMNIYNGSN